MWRYVFLMLRRQPGKSALAGSGFLMAACALILLSATTQTTVVQANQIISQSWRSSYDLVVLPPHAHVTSKETIPADLLEGYDGGISVQQYEPIKHIAGIQVAAPIAYVGYVQMPTPKVLFSKEALAPGYYRLDWTLSAFNGQHNVIERKETTYFYHLTGCTENEILSQSIIDALDKEHVIYDCNDPSVPWSEFSTVDSGTFLLAGIDPTAENQLVHLDKSLNSGRTLTSEDKVHLDTDPSLGNEIFCLDEHPTNDPSKCHKRYIVPDSDIPVLLHQQLPGQITLKSTFARVGIATLDPKLVIARGGATYLAGLPPLQIIFNGVVPLIQNDPQRFSTREIAWNGHSWEQFVPFFGKVPMYYHLNFLYAPSELTYQSKDAPDGSAAFVVQPKGVQEPEAAFRVLHSLHIAQGPKPYIPKEYYFLDPVGSFTGSTLTAQFSNPLNWLPENTYASSPMTLRYDAQGNPIAPTNLLPTTNTAGFILQSPLALTTLNAAAHLRGNAIISAIRIRVSGVQSANAASWKRVQQVAALIEQRTGLRVLVTLGSSPRPTLVYVPGVKQGRFGATHSIEPVGWVEQRLIAIGASILYLAQLGSTRLLLLGTVLGVCLGYLVVAFSALLTAQRREFAILSALGWRPWQPARLFLAQALLLALGGGIVGLGIALLITTLLEAIPIWLIVMWTLPVILVMALLSSLYPLWQIWRMQPAEILRAGSSVSSGKVGLSGLRFRSVVPSIGVLVLRNLARSRPRTLMTIVSLCVSTILLVLMFSSILALHETLTGTLLGNFVLLQTAVPQIAGCIFAVLLSFFSVADLLLLQVRDRQQEVGLLQAIGWRAGMVTTLATIPALRALDRMQVVDILRAE